MDSGKLHKILEDQKIHIEKVLHLSNGDLLSLEKAEMILRFTGQRKVISGSPFGGGISNHLTAVYNHRDRNYSDGSCEMYGNTYLEHLSHVAGVIGLDVEKTTGLSTACPMEALMISQKSIHGIMVTAMITGGIDQNGRCAGDPADMWEENGIFQIEGDEKARFPGAGTINIILHIDAKLTDGALVGAVMLATEAKCAVIREMKISSCYSDEDATGSGTDGIIVVANEESERVLTQIRTDTIMGEGISVVVRDALKESLLESRRLLKMYKEGTYIPY